MEIGPFDPKAREVGQAYIDQLQQHLIEFKPKITLRGSTAFGIAGKGDIELGVYPKATDWQRIIEQLKGRYGKIGNLEKNYARFNDELKGFEVEIILLKGHDAEVDQKLTAHLLSRPKLLKDYEQVKLNSAYSKREYQKAKDKFLRKVIKNIPEGYV